MTEQLRLAAALAHQLPQIALTVWPRRGPAMVVSRDARNHPDISACEFRRLALASHQGEQLPPGISWLVAAHADTELGAAVIALDVTCRSATADRQTDEFARSMSRACLVAELLGDDLARPCGPAATHLAELHLAEHRLAAIELRRHDED